MRVLIAEDDRVFARILTNALLELGHEVVVAVDGDQAWEKVQAEHFPVVITDWVMPGIEGPELCQRIRSINDRSYCYVIILSSLTGRDDRLTALHAGADDFLAKPLDQADLRARLVVADRILGMQARLEEQTEVAEFARNRFSHLFTGLPIACFTYDAEGTVFEWNRRAEEVFGFSTMDALGQPLRELLGQDLIRDQEMAALRGVFENRAFQNQEWAGNQRAYLASGLPLCAPNGAVTGGILSVVDVTLQKQAEAQIARQLVELEAAHRELRKLNERLAALAVTDALTGIPNHRAFQDRLHQLVQETRNGRGFALAMIDVDKFKLFNDEFGHPAGDEVLRAVGGALRTSVRPEDFVARYGGEEFSVLFPDTDEATAVVLCEKVRRAIEATECPYRRITASFGVCGWTPEIDGAQRLLESADLALYAAKEAGRNRVMAHADRRRAAP